MAPRFRGALRCHALCPVPLRTCKFFSIRLYKCQYLCTSSMNQLYLQLAESFTVWFKIRIQSLCVSLTAKRSSWQSTGEGKL